MMLNCEKIHPDAIYPAFQAVAGEIGVVVEEMTHFDWLEKHYLHNEQALAAVRMDGIGYPKIELTNYYSQFLGSNSLDSW
mmetsp:Transcript_19729/g.21445  ORF Transcript_19729/g.21445 Transcript_19729/m.21445 type:complete len:80 (-) Transcript_19729:352-591(-)